MEGTGLLTLIIPFETPFYSPVFVQDDLPDSTVRPLELAFAVGHDLLEWCLGMKKATRGADGLGLVDRCRVTSGRTCMRSGGGLAIRGLWSWL